MLNAFINFCYKTAESVISVLYFIINTLNVGSSRVKERMELSITIDFIAVQVSKESIVSRLTLLIFPSKINFLEKTPNIHGRNTRQFFTKTTKTNTC